RSRSRAVFVAHVATVLCPSRSSTIGVPDRMASAVWRLMATSRPLIHPLLQAAHGPRYRSVSVSWTRTTRRIFPTLWTSGPRISSVLRNHLGHTSSYVSFSPVLPQKRQLRPAVMRESVLFPRCVRDWANGGEISGTVRHGSYHRPLQNWRGP